MLQISTDLLKYLMYTAEAGVKVFNGQKGFYLLGSHIIPYGFSSSQKTREKALEIAKKIYAQGGRKSLAQYLSRWRTWGHAGLPFKIDHVEEVIDSVSNVITQDQLFLMTRNQSCIRSKRSSSDENILRELIRYSNHPVRSSETNRIYLKLKGKSSCLKNFSGHHSSLPELGVC